MKIKRETTTYRTERNPVEIIQEQNNSKRCLFFFFKNNKTHNENQRKKPIIHKIKSNPFES
jgi:hypothetical protein